MIDGRCNTCEDDFYLMAGYCNKWRRLTEEDEFGVCRSGCRDCNRHKCLKCEPGMVLSKADPRVCVFERKCDYPVGPVES